MIYAWSYYQYLSILSFAMQCYYSVLYKFGGSINSFVSLQPAQSFVFKSQGFVVFLSLFLWFHFLIALVSFSLPFYLLANK